MPDYTKPNIKVPVALWGEVKVAAYRKGISAGELVVELLSEKYDDAYRKEKGFPSRESVKRLRDKVESIKASSAVSAPKKAVVEDKQTEGWVNVIRGGTCSKCGATGVKTATNREMKEVCYKCAEVKS